MCIFVVYKLYKVKNSKVLATSFRRLNVIIEYADFLCEGLIRCEATETKPKSYEIFLYSVLSLVPTPGDRRNFFALPGIPINRCH